MQGPKIAIIGSGPAGLMAADILSANFEVNIYDKGKTSGRKFLVAGKGGFNLTNSAVGMALYNQYSDNVSLRKALAEFDSVSTRKWLEDIGVPTFVGSSGRVFPEKGIKPIHVLNKIKERLEKKNVNFHYLHEFIGFNESKQPLVNFEGQDFPIVADYYMFALGGASWSVTGSNSKWRSYFEDIGIKTADFEPSNCGLNVDWSEDFIKSFAGMYLKNIQISLGSKVIKGEAVITDYGLEGNAIYPIIPYVRSSLSSNDATEISIDLKPHNTHQNLLEKIKGRRVRTKNYIYVFNLDKAQLALTKQFTPKENYISPERFIEILKSVKIPISSLRPIEESISTVGGISMEEIGDDFSLTQYPNIFVLGEMLDWDAPTGGFLLQGCFSIAVAAAKAINAHSQE
ncbi:MAG: TIGR03862 family flavoprotein [Saprospiraceae bacterium]|nr:TIGR03862 family flavoprotein [Saprospiraceae bacterium]